MRQSYHHCVAIIVATIVGWSWWLQLLALLSGCCQEAARGGEQWEAGWSVTVRAGGGKGETG